MQHAPLPPSHNDANENSQLQAEYHAMKRMMMAMAVLEPHNHHSSHHGTVQPQQQQDAARNNDDDNDDDDEDDMEWIMCFVHPERLLSSSTSYSNHSVQTKCLLPIRRKRILLSKDGTLLKGTYFVMPEKKAAVLLPGSLSSSCLLNHYTTVMHLMQHGLEGVLAPCRSGKAGREECESAVPYFLKDLAVAGIYFQGLPAAAAAAQQPQQPGKRKRALSQQQSAQKQQFHPVKAPSFENICGSVFAGMMNPVSIPPLHYRRTNDGGNAMAVGIGSAAAAAGRGGAAGGSVQRRGRKKQPWFMAMRGTEIFTVHGNLVLKQRNCGTSIKFMVFFLVQLVKDCMF
jgi:hypothetical protein